MTDSRTEIILLSYFFLMAHVSLPFAYIGLSSASYIHILTCLETISNTLS